MKKNILISILLAIGLIFSQITPPFLGGMRFDFLLSFMFICLIITKDFKSAILIGILSGLLSAFVTTFPGGQIPNIIEKIIVSLYIFTIIKIFKNKINNLSLIFISLTGTFLSGSLFLIIANLLFGLPFALNKLIFTIVIPATIINGFGTIILYRIIEKAMLRANFQI